MSNRPSPDAYHAEVAADTVSKLIEKDMNLSNRERISLIEALAILRERASRTEDS